MHTIRLRGPWEFAVLIDQSRSHLNSTDLPTGQIKLPADWGDTLGADFRGQVRIARKFNCPTSLAQDTRVFLHLAAVHGLINVTLNGTSLLPINSDHTNQRFDITANLLPANQLTVNVELPVGATNAQHPRGRESHADGFVGEVQLQIVETSG